MRTLKIITFILFLPTFTCYGGSLKYSNDPTVNKAAQHVQRAILEYPAVKRVKRRIRRRIYRKLPFDKATIAIIASTAIGLSRGSVDTKVIKKMNMKILGGNMRPDMNYNWKSNRFGAKVAVNWSF